MKQGGTVSERANRLWAVKGLAQDEIPKKYMAKTKKRKAKDNGKSHGSPTTVVNKEYMIQLLTKSIGSITLNGIVFATKANSFVRRNVRRFGR